MITCDYIIKDSSGEERIISNDQLYNILSRATGIYKASIDEVLFSDMPMKKKRIAIRKLGSKGLEHKFIKLFLKLLEYMDQV